MKINEIWKIITTPSCWHRNYKTCPKWDLFITEALKNPKFEVSSDNCVYTIFMNEKEVWITNQYCAYGKNYDELSTVLPSRTTVFKLEKAVNAFLTEKGL